MNHTMTSDISDGPSSPESQEFDESDLLNPGVSNDVKYDVTAQMTATGSVGVAASAAMVSGKKRKRPPYSFETNPAIRKRQQLRLLRKLKSIMNEFTIRIGQQAVVLVCTPAKPNGMFKVFGANPLESVIRNCRASIMQDLETALAQQETPPSQEDPTLHELPPLVVDGIPTPVEKMTQAQLREFIPLMLKYSTGRGKPGWGKEYTRPIWWPSDLPWANVRSDARTEEEKQKVSWTHALRTIVKNCYNHHGREDLLPVPALNEDEDKEKAKLQIQETHSLQTFPGASNTHFIGSTMVQTINNPDGTVSILQVNPDNALVTLSDGSTAQFHTIRSSQAEATRAVQTLAEVAIQQDGNASEQQGTTVMDMNSEAAAQAVASLAEATLNNGQIILSGEDGNQIGMVTIPVSMYQTVVTSISQLNEGQGGMHVAMAPITSGTRSNATNAVEVVTVTDNAN